MDANPEQGHACRRVLGRTSVRISRPCIPVPYKCHLRQIAVVGGAVVDPVPLLTLT